MANLSVVTVNVNGIRDSSKRAGLLQWLRSLNPSVNVVCLQETHCSSMEECHSWFSSSAFSSVVSPGSNKSCGCIILFRPSLALVNSWSDSDGRFLMCEFSFYPKIFHILCLYAPNRNPARDQFFDNLSPKVDPSIPTVLCGDFNAVFDRGRDRAGCLPDDTSRESTAALSQLFDSCCVVDIWRYLHPSASSFTWSRWNGSLSSRIDLVGCPYCWVSSVSSCDITPFPFSDHCAVSFCVSVPDAVPPGPGLWKLNTAILNDDEYVELISNRWRSWRRKMGTYSSLAKWWEDGKSYLKGLTIGFCNSRSKVRSEHRAVLVRLIDHLKDRVDCGFASCLGPYQSALAELGEMDLELARGAHIRSRISWVEEGESSTSFFFRLEKKRAADRHISALREDDGTIVSDCDSLCRSFSSFYSSLFSASLVDPVASHTLLGNVSPSLPSDKANLCEGRLSLDECHRVLLGMARRKAPGSDGFPMEFYVKFWPLLGSDLVLVLNSCFERGSLALSQRRGIISLSFKKGDCLDPRNWRPITLLNVDYKIAARAIAGRLLKVIHLVVASDQTCGVPGRYIGENVALLRDVVSYATESNTPVAILSLDQEKAFDRVDWSFMRATLCRMGFGPSFVRWVDLFYTGVESAINVNGHITLFFSLSRGVRQGCPLSPLLYVLIAEVLACNIRTNPSISGLSIPGVQKPLSPISQYADDTSLILTDDRSSKSAFDTYSLYESGSGAKLNMSKSKGLWLGSWVGRSNPPVALDWSSTKLKILGFFLGLGNLEDDNWRPRVTAVENVLKSWQQRILSFRGRALVINALALSRVWYVASLIYMPAWVLKELSALAFNFFWKGKVELVSHNVVAQPTLSGGFSVTDIRLKVFSLLAQWVRRFVVSPSSWVCPMSFWLRSPLHACPFEVFSRPFSFELRALPPFYRDLILAWRRLDGSFNVARDSLAVGSSTTHHLRSVHEMSAKSCYLFLLSTDIPTPHCVNKFRPVFGDLYWPDTWRELFLFDYDRQVIDLSWKIAHGVLYTAQRLFHFGYDVSLFCFCGPAVESLEHLFFHCPLACSVLSWLQSLMFRFSSSVLTLECPHALFGFNSAELRSIPHVFVYILNVCKYFIWRARNDFRFRDVRPGAIAVIENVKSRVSFHLPLFFKRFISSRRRRFFHRQWGANGVVCSVVDDRLILRL